MNSDAATTPPHHPFPGPYPQARDILVGRLMDRHGLPWLTAHAAVRRAERGLTGRHTALVHQEAAAVRSEAIARINRTFTDLRRGLEPMARALGETLRQLAESLRRLGLAAEQAGAARRDGYTLAPPPAAPRRRPAWQSPYGPPPRKAQR